MKYYKILNKEECHNGLQYKDGLNEDLLPFAEKGSCIAGGIYFASKDIFAFLNYGPWLREVTIPDDAKMIKDPGGSPEKFRANKVILGPRRRVDIDAIIELIDEGADIHVNNDLAFCLAVKNNGHRTEALKLLLDRGANIHADDDCALRWAAKDGHTETVKLFLDHGASIHARKGYALRWAAENGHTETVKLLLDRGANIHACGDHALYWAAAKGHIEIVELLLRHGADVHARDALRCADENGHSEIVKLLLYHGAKIRAKVGYAWPEIEQGENEV
jgi:hypothetical protein